MTTFNFEHESLRSKVLDKTKTKTPSNIFLKLAFLLKRWGLQSTHEVDGPMIGSRLSAFLEASYM